MDEDLRRLKRAYTTKKITADQYIGALERVLDGGSPSISSNPDEHQGVLTYQGLLNKLLSLDEEQLGMNVTLFEFDNDDYHPIPSLVIDNSESNLDPKHPVLAIHLCQSCGRPAPAEITQNYLDALSNDVETEREGFAWCGVCERPR